MYKTNLIGPWPIIDLGASKSIRTDAMVETAGNGALEVLLDTANLGGNSEAFVNNNYGPNPSGIWTPTAHKNVSFGVLLQPLSSAGIDEETPVYVDLNISTCLATDEYAGKGHEVIPFIGLIDSGLTPTDGWDAVNNLVTDYVVLPRVGFESASLNTQILVKDIVSGSIPDDQYVCVGFYIKGSGDTNSYMDYCISARYATYSLNSGYKGI